MPGQYDAVLVMLSIATAVIASFVALDMASRVAAAAGSRRRALRWLAGGALAMGTGIWAMHFVGMLAFSLPVPLAYDPGITALSWLVAVMSSALALHTVSRPRLVTSRLAGAGTLMGLGITAMHYLGMEAMRMHPRIQYDPLLFATSVGFAIGASTAALLIAFHLRHETVVTGLRKKVASSLVMGGAIVGMHYTGMAAANFPEGSVCGAGPQAIGGAWLGFILSGLVAAFLLTTLLGSVYRAIPPTIRSRLVFLVVAALLPVSITAVGLLVYDFHRLRDQQARELVSTARALEATIDKDLAGVEAALRVLSASRLLEEDDLQPFHRQVVDALRLLQANAIVLEETDGDLLMDSRLPPGPASRTARPPHQPGAARAATAFALDPAGDAVTVTVPVDDPASTSPSTARVLQARLSPERLANLLRQQQLPPDWIVSLYDHDGTIVARSHEMQRFAGGQGAPSILRRMALAEEDAVETITLEGIPALSAFSRSQATGWAVSISIPRSNLDRPLLVTVGWLLAGLAAMLAAGLYLAWRIGGTIARSVHALTDPALALGAGERVQVPPLGLTEADQVGRALTQASRLLHLAQHEANHDGLTGLANRSLFRQMVQQQLALTHRNGGSMGVLYIDLDGFKGVNDTHGHAVGDAVLREAAHRLQQGVRAGDLVARLGGDEFAVALVQPGPRGVAKVAGKLVDSLSVPFEFEGLVLKISASIGAASHGLGPADETVTCESLLQQADEAMYEAKQAGKHRFRVADGVPPAAPRVSAPAAPTPPAGPSAHRPAGR